MNPVNEPEPAYLAHPNAIVESPTVGRGTRVWAFAHILPGAVIGEDCNICDGVFIENDVTVGDRVTIKCGVQLWDGVRLGNDVFVGPNATFTNDPFPRSRVQPARFSETIVQAGASIGANATLLPGLTIGSRAMIAAGAVVTKSVPACAIVVGNPGRVVGYVNTPEPGAGTPGKIPDKNASRPDAPAKPTLIKTASAVPLPLISDLRGTLSFGQVGQHLPFVPQRYFALRSVPHGEIRGDHAHKTLHQFFVCLHGACTIRLDDGTSREEIRLASPSQGIHARPLSWCTLTDFTEDAVVLVLASDTYDAADYINDYEEFLELATSNR